MREILYVFIISIFLTSCETSITIIPGSDDGSTNGPRTQSDTGPRNVSVNAFEKEIFKLVNEHRNKLGKNSLKWHDQATVESQDHSQDMASFRVPFGHLGDSLRFSRIQSRDPDDISKFGENVAQNSTAFRAFNAWLRSPGHRFNIEGNWTHTGIGAAQSANGSWYFTQIFLKK